MTLFNLLYNGPLVKTTSTYFVVNGFPPNSDLGCIPSHRSSERTTQPPAQQVALTGCRGPVTLALLRGANLWILTPSHPRQSLLNRPSMKGVEIMCS